MALAYPSAALWPLAWIAFIPLLASLYHADNLRDAVASSFAAGSVFFLVSCSWISHVSAAGCVLLCLYLGLFFVPFGIVVYQIYRKRTSAIFWGAILWVALEFLRGNFLGGFPWNTLACSQAKFLHLVQMASVTGAYGVSFVVMLVNLTLFEGWLGFRKTKLQYSNPLSWGALAILVAALVFGYRELRIADKAVAVEREPIRIAAIQPNVAQEQKWDPAHFMRIVTLLRKLTLDAAASRPLLIVWPETSIPGELRRDEKAIKFVQGLAKECGASLLIGSQDSGEGIKPKYFNAAILIDPNRGIVDTYQKMHLVPFGEFLPGARAVPFIRRFIPIPEDFSAGLQQTIFSLRGQTLRWKEPDGTLRSEIQINRFGAVICFEDIFPEPFRRACMQHMRFMVNITNDAWFKNSGAAMQHANSAIFRAVENRVPLLRATNTGYTCLIDPYGRIRADVRNGDNIFVPGILSAEITPVHGRTIYNQMGDFFGQACLILALVQAFLMIRERRAGK